MSIVSVESEATRNPEFENSFFVKRELTILKVLDIAERNTILEVSYDFNMSIECPDTSSESAFKKDETIERYSPTAGNVSKNARMFEFNDKSLGLLIIER